MKKFETIAKKFNIRADVVALGCDYFKNAPALKYKGYEIVERRADAEKVRAAALKAGYRCIYEKTMWPEVVYVFITEADAAARDLYDKYLDISLETCEKTAHEWKDSPLLNGMLESTMAFYGALYAAELAR